MLEDKQNHLPLEILQQIRNDIANFKKQLTGDQIQQKKIQKSTTKDYRQVAQRNWLLSPISQQSAEYSTKKANITPYKLTDLPSGQSNTFNTNSSLTETDKNITTLPFSSNLYQIGAQGLINSTEVSRAVHNSHRRLTVDILIPMSRFEHRLSQFMNLASKQGIIVIK